MKNKISKLIIYRDLGKDSILYSLADIIEKLRKSSNGEYYYSNININHITNIRKLIF